jgi:hypothetical protein
MSEPRVFPCGPLRVVLELRSVGGDGGPSIQVFDDAGGGRQVLRFDCFRKEPHYHYAPDGKDEIVALDAAANGDPFEWALEPPRSRRAGRAGPGPAPRRLRRGGSRAPLMS